MASNRFVCLFLMQSSPESPYSHKRVVESMSKYRNTILRSLLRYAILQSLYDTNYHRESRQIQTYSYRSDYFVTL